MQFTQFSMFTIRILSDYVPMTYESIVKVGQNRSSEQWRMASGAWFGETSRQSQAEPVKQQHI